MKIFFDALSSKPTTSIGTQAYIISGMQIIDRRYPSAEFILLSANLAVDEHYLQHTNLNYKLVKRKDSIYGTWKQVRDILKRVDIVVSSWGDAYITSPPHVMFRKAIMLKKKGIPLVLFTSSIGPFSGGFKKFMAITALNMFDMLTVRDAITYGYLNKLKLKNVKLIHDSAFVLQPESEKKVYSLLKEAGLKEERYIGVNISVLLYNLFQSAGRDYAKEMADYTLWLRKKFRLPVVMIPHQIYPKSYNYTQEQYESCGGDDRFAINKILNNIKDKDMLFSLNGEYSPMELKGIIKGSEIFIGGRMHSVIASISTATPALIMQYSHKAGGMMKFLNMEHNVWDINNGMEELKQKTHELWNQKEQIKENLTTMLPGIFDEIYNLAALLPNIK